MITTDSVPGSPAWLDLGTPDVSAAAAFYGAVLGWEYEPLGEAAGGYGFLRLDGKVVGALGPLTEEGARSAWTVYFHTDDAQATADAAGRLGGAVRTAPVDLDGEGRMAQLTDSLGGQFAVYEPQGFRGLELADQFGSLCWTELYTTDAAAAREFYGQLFGWRFEDVSMPGDTTYTLLGPADQGEERQHGGLVQLTPEDLAVAGGQPYWHPVFATADCDAALERATERGGTVQMGPEDVPGVGRLAVCLDPAGADFVLLTPSG